MVCVVCTEQAVLNNSLSNGESATSSMLQSSEPRLTYIPAVASGSSDSVHSAVEVPRSSVSTPSGELTAH